VVVLNPSTPVASPSPVGVSSDWVLERVITSWNYRVLPSFYSKSLQTGLRIIVSAPRKPKEARRR
jgi:hypothetical protein